jgi:Flp pilus assembly protein CpaB
MNRARIVVLAIAGCAGLAALYPASGSGDKPAPVAQLPTVDVLVAKSDIGLGQSVKPDDLQWQTWPSATASNSFIRRSDKPEAITLALALRSIADVNMVEVRTEDRSAKQGVNVIRYGVASPQTIK